MQLKKQTSDAIVLTVVVLVGAFLRLYRIAEQPILGDETHSLRALQHFDYRYILTHFFPADISIPQTVIAKFIALNYGLNEVSIRLLPVATGILLLPVAVALLQPFFSGVAVRYYVALLAVSPLLVLYSRFARPYSISTFLVFVAVFTWWRFQISGAKIWGVSYVLSASLSIYFMPASAPAALAPFVFGIFSHDNFTVNWLVEYGKKNIVYFVLLCSLTMLFVMPPFIFDGSSILSKLNGSHLHGDCIRHAIMWLCGTVSELGLFVTILLLLCGIVICFNNERGMTLYLLCIIFTQIVTVVLLSPAGMENDIVLARYFLWVIPIALLFLAVSLARLSELTHLAPWISKICGGLIVVFLIMNGPLPGLFLVKNDFRMPRRFGILIDHPHAHRVYNRIAQDATAGAVLEVPLHYGRYEIAQKVHQRDVFIGFINHITNDTTNDNPLEVALRPQKLYNFWKYVDLENDRGLADRDIHFIVIHKHPRNRKIRIRTGNAIDFCLQHYGRPYYDDTDLVVWRI